jgi:hypothetical protein
MACTVERYDCRNDAKKLYEMGQEAEKQKDAFVSIFPWKKQCAEAEDHVHYIARSPKGIICGWLTARSAEMFGQYYIYLNEISTRRIKDELYGGIGKKLHDALLKDAQEAEVDFIYLYPLNPGVAEIYKTWGYKTERPEIVQLFYILKSEPNREMLDSLMPPNPRQFMTMAYSIASKPTPDPELIALISRVRRRMIQKPDLIRELSSAIDMVKGVKYMEEEEGIPEDDRIPLSEKRAIIAEVLNKVKVGGRRTYKRGGKRRTRKRPFSRI